MRTAKVTVGGKLIEIAERKSRENAAWREQFQKIFSDLAGLIEDVPNTELTDAKALAGLVRTVSARLLVESVEQVRELIVAYAPNLNEFLDEAYDSELADVFVEVVKLAYPFGSLVSSLRALGR